jgi:hypothetical protein
MIMHQEEMETGHESQSKKLRFAENCYHICNYVSIVQITASELPFICAVT